MEGVALENELRPDDSDVEMGTGWDVHIPSGRAVGDGFETF